MTSITAGLRLTTCQLANGECVIGKRVQGSGEIKSLIDKSSKDSIAETEDRARRSKNIIVFGIAEAKSLEKEDRIREEYQKANTLLNELSCRPKANYVRRLGSYKPNQDKPRPLRFCFASKEERDEVLERYRAVKRQEQDTEGGAGSEQGEKVPLLDKNISMKRDMTPLEQREDTTLFKEWKEKRDSSKASGDGAIWVRRRGKVVNIASKNRGDNLPTDDPTPPPNKTE